MIQMQTRLVVADNTGAKEVMCFKVLGGSKKRTAGLGDIIVCSVKTVIAGSEVKKKAVVKRFIIAGDAGQLHMQQLEIIWQKTLCVLST